MERGNNQAEAEVQSEVKEVLKHRWLLWILIGLVCTILVFLNAFESYIAANQFGPYRLEWKRALFSDLLGWYLWVPFTPFILWLVRRFRVNKNNWPRSVFVYALAGILLALARALIPVFVNYFVIWGTSGLYSFIANKYFVLISDFLVAVVVYGLILTFGHALNYYEQSRENELKASRLEAQLTKSQLQALKMQLHPHFLFNTLHSISALQLEDVAAAQKMMARLGDFLRLTLDNVGTQQVTLRREMAFLKCYLEIEQVRFGHRLTTHVEIEPLVLDAQVPNLILQPIVENAIRHGVASQVAIGHISISAKRKDGRLLVRVQDNGPGLIMNGGSVIPFKEGLGLTNTKARLDQLYGSNYYFDLLNAPESGLIVALEIPFVTNGGDQNS